MSSIDLTIPAPTIYGSQLIFTAGNHRYEWEGKAVPSVTTILKRLDKPALVQWAANMAIDHCHAVGKKTAGGVFLEIEQLEDGRKAHNRKKVKAGEIGNTLHDYAKAYMRGNIVPLIDEADVRVQRAVNAFRTWHSRCLFESFQLERPVLSKKYWFAGTPDYFGKIDGQLCVLDYKSGKAIYDEAWLQAMAYKIAIEEERGITGLARIVARFDKETGAFEAEWADPLSDKMHRDMFLSMVAYDKTARLWDKFKRAKAA